MGLSTQVLVIKRSEKQLTLVCLLCSPPLCPGFPPPHPLHPQARGRKTQGRASHRPWAPGAGVGRVRPVWLSLPPAPSALAPESQRAAAREAARGPRLHSPRGRRAGESAAMARPQPEAWAGEGAAGWPWSCHGPPRRIKLSPLAALPSGCSHTLKTGEGANAAPRVALRGPCHYCLGLGAICMVSGNMGPHPTPWE